MFSEVLVRWQERLDAANNSAKRLLGQPGRLVSKHSPKKPLTSPSGLSVEQDFRLSGRLSHQRCIRPPRGLAHHGSRDSATSWASRQISSLRPGHHEGVVGSGPLWSASSARRCGAEPDDRSGTNSTRLPRFLTRAAASSPWVSWTRIRCCGGSPAAQARGAGGSHLAGSSSRLRSRTFPARGVVEARFVHALDGHLCFWPWRGSRPPQKSPSQSRRRSAGLEPGDAGPTWVSRSSSPSRSATNSSRSLVDERSGPSRTDIGWPAESMIFE